MSQHNKPHFVIKEPLLTEKYSPNQVSEKQRVTFKVAQWATKTQIKNAIEKLYQDNGVKVDSIKTLNVKGKPRFTRRGWGSTKDWKKAIVTLKQGTTIDLV